MLESTLPRTRTGTNLFSPGGPQVDLSVVNEINSTGSILDASDLSFDMTCDQTGAAEERKMRIYKNRRSSGIGATARRKSRSFGNRLSGGERQKCRDFEPSPTELLEGVVSKGKSSS